MPDKFLPLTPLVIARKEVRCSAVQLRNDLDKPAASLAAKYAMRLSRVAEPQDSAGVMVAPREGLAPINVDLEDALTRSFTAAGITATGGQILALFNEVVDHYKA